MRGKYLKRIGGLVLAALMLFSVVFVSAGTVEAQRRRRIVIVRPYPYRFYRPFGFRSSWGYPYYGYDPWSPLR
jgi:hypothetical protein